MTSIALTSGAPSLPLVTGDEFFQVLAALLAPRARQVPAVKIAFAVAEDGAFYIDTTSPTPCGRGMVDGADATVRTNRRTLTDILFNRLDADRLAPGQVFAWSGSDTVLSTLATALTAPARRAGRRAAKAS